MWGKIKNKSTLAKNKEIYMLLSSDLYLVLFTDLGMLLDLMGEFHM
jgi:hypothetical protein